MQRFPMSDRNALIRYAAPCLCAVALLVNGGCKSAENGFDAQGSWNPFATGTEQAEVEAVEPRDPRTPGFAGTRRKRSLVPYMTETKEDQGGTQTAQVMVYEPDLAPPPPLPITGGTRVGLLLPLSGANAAIGKAMLNAAQLALFDFAEPDFEILVHDTWGAPEGAADAANLAIADGARMIVGPMLSGSVQAAGAVARNARVPLVGFTTDRTALGNGVYTMGFLPETEVGTVARFAAIKGHKRFAVLAPHNEYGNLAIQALRDAAFATGTEVSLVQRYYAGESNFSDVVRILSERGQVLDGPPPKPRKKRKKGSKEDPEVFLNFDALLLVEGGKRLQNIAAHLPFFDIDPNKVRILGTGQWDEPGIGREPALVGGWFAAPPHKAREEFVKQYRNMFGKTPPRLATLAYDATALAAVLAQAENDTGFTYDRLLDARGFYGRDGIFRFRADGAVERGLAILQVTPKGFRMVGKAPNAFPDATPTAGSFP